jgi:hypothetical protein
MKYIRKLVILTALAVLFLACDSGSSPVPLTPVTSLAPLTSLELWESAATKVTLAAGSWGTAGNGKITGLTPGGVYIVVTGGTQYGVKADGTLGTPLEIGPLTGNEITGLTNGKSYDVYKPVVGMDGGSLDLDRTSYNTIVVLALNDSEDYTINATEATPAKTIIVSFTLTEAIVEAEIAAQELEGTFFDYVFGSTTPSSGVKILAAAIDDEFFILDLTNAIPVFTTTIDVKTAD